MDGSPSVLEEVVYSDNQRVEVLLNEPLRDPLITSHFQLVDDDGNPVTGVTLVDASLINSSRTMVFELRGRSETGDIIIQRAPASDGRIVGSDSGLAMGLVRDVATVPAFDPGAPRVVTASFIDNSRVVLEFSENVYAVTTEDFVLELLNPDVITGVEIASLVYPSPASDGGSPSTSVVTLNLNTFGTGISQGAESLRIRLKRNYSGDIAAFYNPRLPGQRLVPPKRAATHQVQTDSLPFENADAPRLTTAEIDATNTTLTLTFDRGVRYSGSDAAADFTFNVTPGPSGRQHRITTATATAVTDSADAASSNTVMVGLETDPAGGRSTAGEDVGAIEIALSAIMNRSTDVQISRSHRRQTFNFQDTVAPAVASIEGTAPDDMAELNAADNTYTARWRVTFTEPVTGVDAADFSVCVGNDADGFSTACATDVPSGDFGGITVTADSATIYTVTASGLAQAVGRHIDYLLRLVALNSNIEDMAAPTPRSIAATANAEGGTLLAADTIQPRVTEVSINDDNTLLTITFSEAVNNPNALDATAPILAAVTVAPSSDAGEFSEWITGVDKTSAQSDDGNTTLTIVINPTGPEPLNGMSPNGGEVLDVTVPAGIVRDIADVASASTSTKVTLNEVAAPQIRAGNANFGASSVAVGADGEANITWRARFTETVRNVTTASFTLLVVDTNAGTSQSYTAATFATGDSFAVGDAAKFSVTTASGGDTTGGGQYADTYDVETSGLRLLDDSDNLLSYALRMTAGATPAVQDDDTASGRDLTGLPRTTPVQLASDDTDAPVLSDATLDATNTTLTLTFTDASIVRYIGSSATTDFTLSEVPGSGTQWIATATVVAQPVMVSSQTMELRIETQGPPPLNGRSARGLERWQVAIAADAVSDRSNNRVAAGSSAEFTFNDNGNPAIQEITAQRDGDTDNVRWTVVFTEPVENVDGADFALHRFSTATPAMLGDSVEQTGLDAVTPQAGAGGASYTLTVPMPASAGEDRYYALATTRTTNIQRVGGGQNLEPQMQTHPDFAAGIYTHEDRTRPVLTAAAMSTTNARVTFTFSEAIELTEPASSFISQVVVTTQTVVSSAGGLSEAERTAVLNEWITAVPTVSNPVVSGTRLTLDISITGPDPLNGDVPVEGPDYLRITLPPLIADVVDGQARNMLEQVTRAVTLNNEVRPYVLSTTSTNVMSRGLSQNYDLGWRVSFSEPVDGVNDADFYVERADDEAFTTNVAEVADPAISVSLASPRPNIFRDFTVTAVGSSSVRATYYRLRVRDNAEVAERERTEVAVTGAPELPDDLVYSVNIAPDNVPPEATSPVDGLRLSPDNTQAFIAFSESVTGLMRSEVTVSVSSGSEWVTGAEPGTTGFGFEASNAPVPVVLTGPAPLNGMSADGGEVILVRLAAGSVTDRFGNANIAPVERFFTVNEQAAPQVRPGTFVGTSTTLAAGGVSADLSWVIRFTETVRDVGLNDFTLVSVTPGTTNPFFGNTVYTGAEYTEADDMMITVTPGALSTTASGQLHYDRYTITVRGVTSTIANQVARYAIRLDRAATVMDDDSRPLVPPTHIFSGIQVAARDATAPEFTGATLSADNTELTLAFNESVRYTGSDANGDFSIAVVAGASQYQSVTGAIVTAVRQGANSLILTIQGQGPAPLNGLSAVGGEWGTVTINRANVVDRGNNALVAGGMNSDTFTFNDNAAPRLASARLAAPPAQTPGEATQVRWTMVFTEPVTGADDSVADDFRIYKLPSAGAALSAESGSPVIGSLSPNITRVDGRTYTLAVTIPEPVGEDAYYAVSLADGNNIMAAAGPSGLRAVPAAGRTAPSEATDAATLQDLSPPALMGDPVLSADNGEITYTFNEDVQFANTAENLVSAVAVARDAAAVTSPLSGVNRVRVLQQAITDFSITAAAISGAEVRLTLNIDGMVTIPAPDYLRVTFPAGQIQDLPAGGVGSYGGETRTFSLTDEAQPTVAETSATTIARQADNTYNAEWRVSFSEPVNGVTAGRFSVCMVAAAADDCSAGTMLAGAAVSVNAQAGSDFRTYTVAASALAQQVGPTWYRLRVDNTAGIVERLGAGRALTMLPQTAPAHRADDTIGPVAQVGGLAIINTGTTALLIVPFSETLGTVDRSQINVALSAPMSEWITGVEVSGATADAATLTVMVTTTGPLPLNGLSPDGGEGLALSLDPGAVTDESGNNNAVESLQFTLNENAAPRVRNGGITGQSGQVMVNGAARTADLTWRVVFTETVRGVTSASFTLLRVTGTVSAMATDPVDFVGSVTTAVGSRTTEDGAFAETYTVVTTVDAGPPGSPARYILAFSDTGVADDDGRSWSGEQFRSAQVSVDDRVPPVVVAAEATAAAQPGRITITVTFNEPLAAASITRIGSEFGGFATGVLQNPNAAYATVRQAQLVAASGSGNQLIFTANLGGTLDNGESAIGVEQFTFTIPAGVVVDNSARRNATTMTTPFTITVPESGAPEVTAFSVVSSEEDMPDSDNGVFDITYLVEFTEPVSFTADAASAFVLYRVADRTSPSLRPGGGVTTVASALTSQNGMSPARITATPAVETTGTSARYLVTYQNVQRPPSNTRGYVAFLDASLVTDVADAANVPTTRALEDCSWTDAGANGCLSASADVSDTIPPKFAGAQASYGNDRDSGLGRLWVTFNEPVSVPGGSDGSPLQGFAVNLRMPDGDEVGVNTAFYRATTQTNDSNASVELQLAGAVTATTVYVTYQPQSSGLVIHDNAQARGLNGAPNPVVSTLGPVALTLDAARDSDGDGVPDSFEARIGANPWAAADNDPQAEGLPGLALTSRGAGAVVHIAYSGIRAADSAAGIFEHLGLSVTPDSAHARTLAYYQDNCATSQLLSGDCTLVDFGNIPAAENRRIVWLSTNEMGYPVTATQTIQRVPEVNMANERLFFRDMDTNPVTVAAVVDSPAGAAAPTLVVSPALTVSGLSAMVAKNDFTGVSQTYTIAGLTDSGGADVLWRVASGSGALTASSYSLGLSPRTQVVKLGNDVLPPSLGRPRLATSGGDERLGLTAGDFTVTLAARHAVSTPTVVEVNAPVLSAITPMFSAGSDEVSVSFTVPANARSATKTSVSLRITVAGTGPSESSLLMTWPLVPSGNLLAGVTSDTDADGIPDNTGADRFTGDSALPVAVAAGGREAAGRAPWHHIRAGLPQHTMCVGGLTLRFAAAADNPFDSYGDWAASFSTAELETVGVSPPQQALHSAYHFGVCGVDYDTAPASSTDTTVVITGGRAVVVIPLPQDLHDDASLGIYKYRSADDVWQPVAARSDDFEWGFVPLQNGVCPNTNEVPASSVKQPGDACLVVSIRDGGDYDNDGSINGVIDDPVGVRAGGVSGAPVASGGGGAFGPFGLFAILLSVAALLLRKRRRAVNA